MLSLLKHLMKDEGREGKIIAICATLFWIMLAANILNGVFR